MRNAGGGQLRVRMLRRAKMALALAIMGGGFSDPTFLLFLLGMGSYGEVFWGSASLNKEIHGLIGS